VAASNALSKTHQLRNREHPTSYDEAIKKSIELHDSVAHGIQPSGMSVRLWRSPEQPSMLT
jgi:hypothetical protein